MDPTPPQSTPLDVQSYQALRYRASLALLVAAPALILLPPRKLDIYTFILGSSWCFCLGEVAAQHGRDPWRGFRRVEELEKEKMAMAGGKGGVVQVNGEGVRVGEWKGEKIARDVRPRDEEGKSISELIMEQMWDVWEQKDRSREGGKGDGKEEKEKK